MADYRKVDEALAAGRFWRARENLQGRIRGGSYDSELYHRYGKVLLDMKDLLEAGKYLFLSGIRAPEYTEAIQTFMGRHGQTPTKLLDVFPSGVRGAGVARVPECVWAELREHGIDSAVAKERLSRKRNPYPTVERSLENRIVEVGIGVVFAVLLLGLVIQSFRGLAWLGDKIGLY